MTLIPGPAARLMAAAALSMLLVGCGDETDPVATGDTSEEPGATTTTAPSSGSGTIPDRPADMTGTITAVTAFEPITEDCVPAEEVDPDGVTSSEDPPVCTPADIDLLGTALVEEAPGVQEGRKISLSVTGSTVLAGDGLTTFDDLTAGQTVEVWTGDFCAESYPEQCGGVAIRATG